MAWNALKFLNLKFSFTSVFSFPPAKDHCQPNPCLNNGRCVNQGSKFLCICRFGSVGDRCSNSESNILTLCAWSLIWFWIILALKSCKCNPPPPRPPPLYFSFSFFAFSMHHEYKPNRVQLTKTCNCTCADHNKITHWVCGTLEINRKKCWLSQYLGCGFQQRTILRISVSIIFKMCLIVSNSFPSLIFGVQKRCTKFSP